LIHKEYEVESKAKPPSRQGRDLYLQLGLCKARKRFTIAQHTKATGVEIRPFFNSLRKRDFLLEGFTGQPLIPANRPTKKIIIFIIP
jgi:hypothetical protein